VLFVGFLRPGELHHFHFLELVLPNDAAHVFAIGTGLAAEARSVCSQGDWQPRSVQGLVPIDVRHWDFCGRDEPEVAVALGDPEQILGEFWKLPGSIHRLRVDQVRRKNFRVAVLARVQVEHEIHQRAFQLCPEIPIQGEPSAG
jgi:hypothetical protein